MQAKLTVHNPVYTFLSPGLLLLALWTLAPIDFVYKGNPIALMATITLPITFAAGLLIGFRHRKKKFVPLFLNTIRIQRFVYTLATLGSLGFLIIIYVRVFVRAGGLITSDIVANREMLSEGGSGFLSLIGGILASALFFLPFGVFLLRKAGAFKSRHLFILLVSVAYPAFDAFFQGTRSTFVIYIGMYVASKIFVDGRISPLSIVRWTAFFLVLLCGATYLFIYRTESVGIDPISSMYVSVYAHFAPASNASTNFLMSVGTDGIGGLFYAYIHACQYLLHGFYELIYIVTNVVWPTTHGLQTFYIPSKMIFSLMGSIPVEELIVAGVLRSGVYTTLWGPLVYDFGVIGSIFASMILGYGCGLIARRVARGAIHFLPLYLAITGLLPFAFTVNLFTSGTGQYLILFAIALSLLMLQRKFDLHSKASDQRQVNSI